MKCDIKWQATINGCDEKLLRFYLNSSLNTLPTGDNLKRWGQKVKGTCPLCGLPQTLKHILCNCSFTARQGRYKWRHNKVLQLLQDNISQLLLARKKLKAQTDDMPFINFVKAGESGKKKGM
jgi:hypothetical protein